MSPRYLGHMNWNCLLHNPGGNTVVEAHKPGQLLLTRNGTPVGGVHEQQESTLIAFVVDAGGGYTFLQYDKLTFTAAAQQQQQQQQGAEECKDTAASSRRGRGGLGVPGSKARVLKRLKCKPAAPPAVRRALSPCPARPAGGELQAYHSPSTTLAGDVLPAHPATPIISHNPAIARPYRNSDIRAFNLPIGRPGPGHCGYIGKSFLGEQDSPDAPPYERTMLRTWHWLDEEQGLLAQANVTDCNRMGKHVLPGYLPREGEPAHYQKLFTWPWTDISPSR
ncbi:hypothetical protein TSOC_002554 [Tetrabaena socialis]|uniref:Uncharacterized protein n=1 Tax=Tetrabaena socialis TaxID=47790 RepID=A0A2J8ADV8_9CHLO|nr:hypothetical protein TSOC_002554 [Tetrabaena socialis]|eukprot:PNH10700.1 hypothetical protein TSOC_002554 [Tetrabaena socialis]